MRLSLKSIVVGFIIGVLVTSIIAFFVNINIKKQKFVYVDIDRVISEVTYRLRGDNSVDINKELKGYKSIFDAELKRYAKEKDVIVFSSPKAIAGAEDQTEEIIKRAFGMRSENSLKESKRGSFISRPRVHGDDKVKSAELQELIKPKEKRVAGE